MQFILVDLNPDVCLAWQRYFPPGTRIHCGQFKDVLAEGDALVTAGNSFGLMDGGVDLAVARAFPGIEQEIQHIIRTRYHGELSVGQSFCVAGVRAGVIYAPTMRVPMVIAGTDAVYRAMWSALLTAERFAVDTLIVPGLGTGAGRMTPDEAARQMALAWKNFNAAPESPTWPLVSARHHEIVGTVCPDCPEAQAPVAGTT